MAGGDEDVVAEHGGPGEDAAAGRGGGGGGEAADAGEVLGIGDEGAVICEAVVERGRESIDDDRSVERGDEK